MQVITGNHVPMSQLPPNNLPPTEYHDASGRHRQAEAHRIYMRNKYRLKKGIPLDAPLHATTPRKKAK